MRKVHRFMELFWLVVSLLSAVMALYMLVRAGLREGGIYLLFPFLAGAMYGVRRWVRKKMEKQEE